MPAVAERLRRAYPAPLGRAGVGSIPANPDARSVPSFRRWRFEMKLSPFFVSAIRTCGVCCPPVPHSGQIASGSGRRSRHHSPEHARPQGSVLSPGRVRSSGHNRLWQSPVLHQHVGHGLAK